ncbi:hypothetical protein EKO04_001369 [Ascochyta lentis]|uniref:Uncharacterized protein n=1 Tax=Ascochyta lentis TaxID=205686 RepID=A0A8H7JAY8_9PLEO|nr:hypothetical protein EKO04_001369 [Ascochyta lentis]
MRSLQPSTSHSVQYGSRLTPATHGTLKTPSQAFKNPNLIPVLSRHTRNTAVVTPDINLQQDAEPEERLPQIWHPSIDDLVRRTAHDYDLVMNYERDAEGGQRWLPEDIATIRDVGKRLHSDIFALRRSQRAVAYQGDQDKKMMQQIKRDANFLKLLCERVQRAINKYEQKCEFELLRDGVYAQDEDGSFYKPTTPQQHVAEGEFLWDDVQPSIKGTEDDHLNIHNRHDRLVHKDRHDEIASTWKFQTPPEETQETHRRLPNRSLAVDFLFQQPSFDTVKLEAARQSPPRRSDRVFDSRTSNAHQDVPPGKAPSPCQQILHRSSPKLSQRIYPLSPQAS